MTPRSMDKTASRSTCSCAEIAGENPDCAIHGIAAVISDLRQRSDGVSQSSADWLEQYADDRRQSRRTLSSDSVSDGSKGVRVKPLNWDDQVDANGNWSSRATDEFGRKYRVSHEDAIDGDWYWFGALRFTSPEQAKAAAQRRAATPSEPTEAMLNAARDWSVKKYGQGIGNDAACGCWGAMYAAIDSRFLSALELDSGTGGQQPVAWLSWIVVATDAPKLVFAHPETEGAFPVYAPTEPKAGVVSEDRDKLLACLDKAAELSRLMVQQGARKQIGALYSQAVTLGHMVVKARAALPNTTGEAE